MARAASTPPAPPAEEVVTPLQKVLTGTFLLSIILCPLLAFGLFVSPIYKAPNAYYQGDYYLIGFGGGVALSFVLAFLWMAYLPGLFGRRAARKIEGEAEARGQNRADQKKAREERPAEGE